MQTKTDIREMTDEELSEAKMTLVNLLAKFKKDDGAPFRSLIVGITLIDEDLERRHFRD